MPWCMHHLINSRFFIVKSTAPFPRDLNLHCSPYIASRPSPQAAPSLYINCSYDIVSIHPYVVGRLGHPRNPDQYNKMPVSSSQPPEDRSYLPGDAAMVPTANHQPRWHRRQGYGGISRSTKGIRKMYQTGAAAETFRGNDAGAQPQAFTVVSQRKVILALFVASLLIVPLLFLPSHCVSLLPGCRGGV